MGLIVLEQSKLFSLSKSFMYKLIKSVLFIYFVLSIQIFLLPVYALNSHNSNSKRNNQNNKKLYKHHNENYGHADDEHPFLNSYGNTRSVNNVNGASTNYKEINLNNINSNDNYNLLNSDSCHLNIECNNNKITSLRLPIYGPKGDQGPPGMTGLRGEKGEPGIAGIPAREPPAPNFSAFFAALYNNTGPFKEDKNLVFTNVITNFGNDYDSNTGMYTAKYNGIYQFLITISATGRQKAGVNIMKNKQSILTVWSESEPWSTSSQTVILRLAQNDKVYLRLQARASHVHGYMYSSFGGSLLFEEVK